ncbi:MAG: Asp23/Gls24 family envelope stress response protein [Erysipelotrichales bacterium]|nr:Asp23/Gls24 family envelope stress response protein [Erysipelotrichales bacterium]
MTQYIFIDNYNKLGTMAFSRTVFEQIVHTVTENVMNHSNAKGEKKRIMINSPAKISIKNNQVFVKLEVTVSHNENVAAICRTLQEEIAAALTAQTEMVPFRIDIKVTNIK